MAFPLCSEDRTLIKLHHIVNFNPQAPPPDFDYTQLSESEKQGLERGQHWWAVGTAYALEHATRPSTIGLVLASNPVALLAWSVVSLAFCSYCY